MFKNHPPFISLLFDAILDFACQYLNEFHWNLWIINGKEFLRNDLFINNVAYQPIDEIHVGFAAIVSIDGFSAGQIDTIAKFFSGEHRRCSHPNQILSFHQIHDAHRIAQQSVHTTISPHGCCDSCLPRVTLCHVHVGVWLFIYPFQHSNKTK